MWGKTANKKTNKKPQKTKGQFFTVILRRKRDSNPRRCDPQQFSRLPHSTTLPFLQCGCKYITLFYFLKPFLCFFKLYLIVGVAYIIIKVSAVFFGWSP